MKDFMTPEVIAKLRAVHAVPAELSDEQIKNREDLNPATVAFYRDIGYLPASLVNYFGRLGWSLDDKTEIIPLDMMIANFGLDRVNDSPASFDPEKLLWLAGEYMRSPAAGRKSGRRVAVLAACRPDCRERRRSTTDAGADSPGPGGVQRTHQDLFRHFPVRSVLLPRSDLRSQGGGQETASGQRSTEI